MSSKNVEFPLESLLSARKLVAPQLLKDKVFFMSDMSGMYSLYSMDRGGSIPQPLLPAGLPLQNPHLMNGLNYLLYPKLNKILVMIDDFGDENYQPHWIPMEGGIPESIFGEERKGQKLMLFGFDKKKNIAYFNIDDRKTPDIESIQVHLETMEVISFGKSKYNNVPLGYTDDHQKVILADTYLPNDFALFIWEKKKSKRELLFGTPLEDRKPKGTYPLLGLGRIFFFDDDKKIISKTTLFDDLGGIAYLDLENPNEFHPIEIEGIEHTGVGQLTSLDHVIEDKFVLTYNIDGVSWLYQARLLTGKSTKLVVEHTLFGKPPLNDGVELGIFDYVDESKSTKTIEYIASFTKATSPSQLYLLNPSSKEKPVTLLSNEKILGIDSKFLSEGEDASYNSFDDLRISARLYLPSEALGLKPPYPLVLYVHGGPQGQERPDFTWFSMPLIQYLSLNGFAVFVPNVRGSRGYGQKYMKMVDRDWGGNDMKDHVEGLKMLEKDSRIDSTRRAVTGRSYGGYMTLMLSAYHPELWKASCDMFGPYNILTFIDRLPETWKTYFYIAIGHPEKDREFLLERSPQTYFHQIKAPMMVIQGKNDPRVVEAESADVVAQLRKQGVETEYLMFEDEGHDVNKFKNKVITYKKITEFFKKHLA
ncbi:MAG: alpha/beta hydrolase family protein [Candidatus Ranarchaeia archaeon]|jgi:esterase/lipase